MKIKPFIYLFFIIILYACAQIRPLSGGEKDSIPPKEIESIPANGSVNFNSTEITITFDEFIKLNQLNSQLIVSPIISPEPEIQIKGKKLIIKLPKNLSPNTTYSLNFGSAITDITENNSYPNYKYVFSTGDFIDSLSYSGIVVDAFNQTPQEKVYVQLYDKTNDSIPLKEAPKYLAITDKDGFFKLTNIAHGNYKLFAIKDINTNYLFDLPNEMIGFKESIIKMDSSSSNNRIQLFEEYNAIQYIKKNENKIYGKVDILFNIPTSNLKITPLNFNEKNDTWFLKEQNEDGDSLTLWLQLDNNPPSIEIIVSDTGSFIDTTSINLLTTLKDSVLKLETNITTNFDLNKNIIITSQRPSLIFNKNNIRLLEDSIPKNIEVNKVDSIGRKYSITYAFKENKDYHLLIPPSTFKDIYKLENDSLSQNFKTKSKKEYGAIFLTINPNFSDNYIIQLFRKKTLINQSYHTGIQDINFNYLMPGEYELKLIIDENNNKKWDTGNYLKKKQAEKVIYYQKELKIRANWDNKIQWIINE